VPNPVKLKSGQIWSRSLIHSRLILPRKLMADGNAQSRSDSGSRWATPRRRRPGRVDRRRGPPGHVAEHRRVPGAPDPRRGVHTATSGGFLYLIGILNLVALLGIVRVFRAMRRGQFDEDALHARLNARGLLNRILVRLTRSVTRPVPAPTPTATRTPPPATGPRLTR
jgi:hypothetical protein